MTFTVTVKTLCRSKLTVEATGSSTIKDLQELLAQKYKYHGNLSLVHGERVFPFGNTETLEELGIGESNAIFNSPIIQCRCDSAEGGSSVAEDSVEVEEPKRKKLKTGRYVFVKTLTGETLEVPIRLSHTVRELKVAIHTKSGVPPEQVRLIFCGKLLEDLRRLEEYNIGYEATLHMVLRLRGMISSFADNGDPYLMGKTTVKPTKEQMEEVVKKWQERCIYVEINLLPGMHTCKEISKTAVGTLKKFMDIIYDHVGDKKGDIKIVLGEDMFNKDKMSYAIVAKLLEKFWTKEESNAVMGRDITKVTRWLNNVGGDGFKCVLRRTSDESKGCIGWHLDGGYATRTTQLCLNGDDEYEGGRLMFYTPKEGLLVPERPALFYTTHKRSQLHAVSRVTRGVRYSLFLVNNSNGVTNNGADCLLVGNTLVDTLASLE